ncbi:MAG: FAD:protein FMN transferase [Fuerstiella sp.]
MSGRSPNRREFLLPRAADLAAAAVPTGGSTVRVSSRAMACDFSVILNPEDHDRVTVVGDVLELAHSIESWLSVYRTGSEISQVNRTAASKPVRIRPELFSILQTAQQLHTQTDGAFDIAAGAQIQLWRACRAENRLPTDEEIEQVRLASGSQNIELNEAELTVRFRRSGLLLDPGAIGKGFALDEAAEWLPKLEDAPASYLLHGGHSSLLARGVHNNQDGWPVGIGNPLFTKKRLGTVLLKDQAMSTSGSNIQFFRVGTRRYGHILDPRTAWPTEGMLSATVFAESAAIADALSTAFFVLGVEKAVKCCDNLRGVGAILIPFPERGKQVTPTIIGVPSERIFWDEQQVRLA